MLCGYASRSSALPILHRIKVIKRAFLYRAGDCFNTLYAIRSGSIKTVVLAEVGHEQVTGFHMLGDLRRLDGICSNRHATNAIALEDTDVCALPFAQLESLAQKLPTLQRNLNR